MNTFLQTEEKNIRLIKGYRAVSLILVAVAVLFRTLNLFLFYEADIGYYRADTVLPTLFRVFLLLCTVFFAVLPFALDKQTIPTPTQNSATSIAALIVGATFAVTALVRYCASAVTMTRSTVVLFVTGGLAAVYFILLAVKKLSASAALITGMGAILWFGGILVVSYFDVTVTMNAPSKIALHLASLGGMLLMLAEMRYACDALKKRFYLFALSASTLFLCVSSIPSLIADAAGILETRDLGYSDFVSLALGLFGLLRLCSPFRTAAEEEDTVTPDAIVKKEETAEVGQPPEDGQPTEDEANG